MKALVKLAAVLAVAASCLIPRPHAEEGGRSTMAIEKPELAGSYSSLSAEDQRIVDALFDAQIARAIAAPRADAALLSLDEIAARKATGAETRIIADEMNVSELVDPAILPRPTVPAVVATRASVPTKATSPIPAQEPVPTPVTKAPSAQPEEEPSQAEEEPSDPLLASLDPGHKPQLSTPAAVPVPKRPVRSVLGVDRSSVFVTLGNGTLIVAPPRRRIDAR